MPSGVTPRHAGSGPRAGGLGGGLSTPAGFGEPRKLIDFKQFGSRRRHLRAYRMVSDARKIYEKKREKKSYIVTVLAKVANKEGVNTRRHTSPRRQRPWSWRSGGGLRPLLSNLIVVG